MRSRRSASPSNRLPPSLLDGTVEAVHQTTVSAQTAGRVTEIKFDVNDRGVGGHGDHAHHAREEINNGRAFELDKVKGGKTVVSGITLTWDEPYLDDGDVHPTRYDIYRQAIGDPVSVFVKIGETVARTFTDETPGSFEYEIVAVAPEAP